MSHIENLTIHHFRGLSELSLQGLGQINLLVGVNNSGKTTVLEAISTYCRPLEPLEWLNTARRREVKSSRQSILDALKWLFPQRDALGEVDFYQGETHVSGSGSFPIRESWAIYQEIEGAWESQESQEQENDNFSEDELDIEEILLDTTKRGADLNLKATISNSSESDQELSENFQFWESERFIKRKAKNNLVLPVDTVTPVSHRIELLQVQLLSEATLQRYKSEVINLLQTLDLEILDLEILSRRGSRPTLYIDHQQLGLAPLSAFGDGVRRLLFIASTLAKVRGGILLIDEIETAIHTEALHGYFSWLVQWCREMDVQLFATTHSLEAVDALLVVTEPKEDLVVYRLEQRESQTKAIRIDWKRLQRLREELGQEVRW
jgi:AAA15 family ATPase/GTPase